MLLLNLCDALHMLLVFLSQRISLLLQESQLTASVFDPLQEGLVLALVAAGMALCLSLRLLEVDVPASVF